MRKQTVARLCLCALLLAPACNPFRRSRQPKVPPPVAPAPRVAQPLPEPASAPAYEFPDPPALAGVPPQEIPPPPLAPEEPPAPPPRPLPRRAVVPKPEPEPEPETPRPAAVPRLTQLLTPEEERRYNREIDDSLERARHHLALLAQRTLNPEQQLVLERVHAFLQQTIELRELDLVTARSLAQRAELLARDLERSTR